MKKIFTRIYDGAAFCSECQNCPVVDHNRTDGSVALSDPTKPERGSFMMTVEEYNTLLANAKPVVK